MYPQITLWFSISQGLVILPSMLHHGKFFPSGEEPLIKPNVVSHISFLVLTYFSVPITSWVVLTSRGCLVIDSP